MVANCSAVGEQKARVDLAISVVETEGISFFKSKCKCQTRMARLLE